MSLRKLDALSNLKPEAIPPQAMRLLRFAHSDISTKKGSGKTQSQEVLRSLVSRNHTGWHAVARFALTYDPKLSGG
jgi:hypothetical protein